MIPGFSKVGAERDLTGRSTGGARRGILLTVTSSGTVLSVTVTDTFDVTLTKLK